MQIKKKMFVFTFRDHSIVDSDFPGERGVVGEAVCVDVIIWESTNRCGVLKPAQE